MVEERCNSGWQHRDIYSSLVIWILFKYDQLAYGALSFHYC